MTPEQEREELKDWARYRSSHIARAVLSLLDREEQLIKELNHVDAIAENWRREAFRKYPTPEAYDAACKALNKHRQRADHAESLIAEKDKEIERLENHIELIERKGYV